VLLAEVLGEERGAETTMRRREREREREREEWRRW
jgi:hypothetical protein